MRAHHLDDLELLAALSSVGPRRPSILRHLAKCAICRERQQLLGALVPRHSPKDPAIPHWDVVNPVAKGEKSRGRWPVFAVTATIVFSAVLWWPYVLWSSAPTGFDAASIMVFGRTRQMQSIHGHGQVTVKYSPRGTWALIETHSLAVLPRGQVYEAWWIQGIKHYKAAVFLTSTSGHVSLWIRHNGPLNDVNALGITLEPSPGTSKPTGPKAFFLKLPPLS